MGKIGGERGGGGGRRARVEAEPEGGGGALQIQKIEQKRPKKLRKGQRETGRLRRALTWKVKNE